MPGGGKSPPGRRLAAQWAPARPPCDRRAWGRSSPGMPVLADGHPAARTTPKMVAATVGGEKVEGWGWTW
jgi:hypothetical protein